MRVDPLVLTAEVDRATAGLLATAGLFEDVAAISPIVSGPAHALAAWPTGRASGAGRTVVPDRALPALPPWM